MNRYILLACILLLVQAATAQICEETIPADTPDNRFIVNGNDVIDTETGLIWHRCSLGQTGNDCNGDANLYNWQEALQAAAPPWRLPNIKELGSIQELKCHSPAINLAIFPNTVSSEGEWSAYWSASPYSGESDQAWLVVTRAGNSGTTFKDNYLHVRLVRGGE